MDLCDIKFFSTVVPVFPVAPIKRTFIFPPSLTASFAASEAIETEVFDKAVSVLIFFAHAIAD